MTFVSFVYIILIISPGLMLFLDFDFINSLINFNVYVLGYQWAWNYNVLFNNLSYSFDQLILSSLSFSSSSLSLFLFSSSYVNCLYSTFISSLNLYSTLFSMFNDALTSIFYQAFENLFMQCLYFFKLCGLISFSWNISVATLLINATAFINSFNLLSSSFYLCLFNQYLLLSLYSTISLYVYSFDVIHSFGYHSFGFKSDAIPGRVNLVSSLSLFFNGYFVSYCYELCGIGHTSMLSSIVIL